VNARNGRDLWSHIYDSAAADLPASQNQIERDIAAQVHASAPDRARMIDTRKLGPRAYDLHLRGSYHLRRPTAQDTDQAIGLYEQAIAILRLLLFRALRLAREGARSVELRPDQKDTDSLPDYGVLAQILRGYISKIRNRRNRFVTRSTCHWPWYAISSTKWTATSISANRPLPA